MGECVPRSTEKIARSVLVPPISPANSMMAHTPLTTRKQVRVAFAVWRRTFERVEQDVQVANHGKQKRVMNPDLIGNRSLYHWNDRTADDRHIHEARSSSCQW